MFESLDDRRFEGVRATYGLATDAPRRLRALADADPKIAAEALHWIEGDYFHQGLYCDATPLIVPYLLEVAPRASPVQRAVVLLLGEILRGGADAANDLAGHAPSPAADACESEARSAVEAGQAVLAALLDAADPLVRGAAAWTLAGLGPVAHPALIARLRIEPDVRARICLWLALSTVGPLDPTIVVPASEAEADAPSEHDVVAVLAASRPLDDEGEGAFLRLLGVPEQPWLPFAEGSVKRIALHHLDRLGPEEPRLVPFLQRAIEGGLSGPHGDVATLLQWTVFPDGVPRRASELNDAQRWAMRHIWIGEARGVRLAYGDFAGQHAFVDGDGPLDDVMTFRGHTGTVAELLLEHPNGAEALLAERVRELPAARVFDLATSIVRGGLGAAPTIGDAVVRTCSASVNLERTLAYLEGHEPSFTQHEAQLLLAPYAEAGAPSPEALDPLAMRWLENGAPPVAAWVAALPPRRRVELLAKRGDLSLALWPLCDRAELGAEVWRGFVAAPSSEHGYDSLLAVPSSLLHEGLPTLDDASKRAYVEGVVADRAACTRLSLSARRIHTMTLEVMPPQGQRLAVLPLDRVRTPDDLEPIRHVLRESPDAVLTIYPTDIPAWIVDTLREELGSRLVR